MLTILKTKPKIRHISTYDMEWIPGSLEIRLVGVFDIRGYRCYKTVEAFLNGELTSTNRGRWFYAHAGGLADVQFVFYAILRLNERRGCDYYSVKASFSGSSAIIVHVSRGKNSWHFVDSYWLFRDKLSNIGRFIGLAKGGLDDSDETSSDSDWEQKREEKRRWFAEVSQHELLEYNQRDCEILWKAIDQFEDVLRELGGQLNMTIASTALGLFRRKYLSRDIMTSREVNDKAMLAYVASRVEVYQRNVDDACYYDINSSFPYSMTQPLPGEYRATGRSIPDGDWLYITDVEIEIPETFLPPTPYRVDNRIFFPVGKWRAWLTNVDIELLLREGGTIHRVYETLIFHPFHDLRYYVEDIYERRKNASDEFERIVYKYLLNCLYGKFAEKPVKTQMHINPEFTDYKEMLFPGVWLEEKWVPVPHMHVPISAHVTALSRRLIFDYMSECRDFHYCDTDGFSTTERHLATGKELGALKLEKEIVRGEFVAPKVYHLETTEGKHLTKAKGFSRMTLERFQKIAAGQAVVYERMARIRENFRRGRTMPREEMILKRLNLKESLPKRFTYPDGHTRPWHMDELERIFKK